MHPDLACASPSFAAWPSLLPFSYLFCRLAIFKLAAAVQLHGTMKGQLLAGGWPCFEIDLLCFVLVPCLSVDMLKVLSTKPAESC
jgi:hypothetical protein